MEVSGSGICAHCFYHCYRFKLGRNVFLFEDQKKPCFLCSEEQRLYFHPSVTDSLQDGRTDLPNGFLRKVGGDSAGSSLSNFSQSYQWVAPQLTLLFTDKCGKFRHLVVRTRHMICQQIRQCVFPQNSEDAGGGRGVPLRRREEDVFSDEQHLGGMRVVKISVCCHGNKPCSLEQRHIPASIKTWSGSSSCCTSSPPPF